MRRRRQKSEEQALRRDCEVRLDALELQPPYDLPAFIEAIERSRGRTLTIASLPSQVTDAGECSAMWVAAEDRDWILVDRSSHTENQDALVAHELGHMIFGHDAGNVLPAKDFRAMMPNLNHARMAEVMATADVDDPDRVVEVMRRADYDSVTERQAEMIGSLILARTMASTRPVASTSPETSQEAAEVLARLTRMLG